jgi:hypothetical protein
LFWARSVTPDRCRIQAGCTEQTKRPVMEPESQGN